jgi:hypothetical protein
MEINMKEFTEFAIECFGKADWTHQHEQYDFGHYSLFKVLAAFNKWDTKNLEDWEKEYTDVFEFDYNCSDCSFPKFKNIKTGKTEACPCCGD